MDAWKSYPGYIIDTFYVFNNLVKHLTAQFELIKTLEMFTCTICQNMAMSITHGRTFKLIEKD